MVMFLLKILLPFAQKETSPNEAKPQRVDKKRRARIYDQLHELQKAKLTPEQEVIKKYQLFLETMAAVELGKDPSLPPTDYYRELSKNLPTMEKDFSNITNIFCDVLYGLKKTNGQVLQNYRASVDRILHQFL